MPADTSHPTLVQPENPNATIWKYIDLPELIYLLQERKLWFSRLDMLGDPFEGSVERSLVEEAPMPVPPDVPEVARAGIEKFQRFALRNAFHTQRLSACISCW